MLPEKAVSGWRRRGFLANGRKSEKKCMYHGGVLGIVLLIYDFNDLVGLLLNRYYSPYWNCNSVWAITQMYAETPCVSKVRFEQVDGGKGGIEKSILSA